LSEESVIYIVDDDPTLLITLEQLVKAVYPNVRTFSSAGDFLDAYDPDNLSCLVLDIAMPEINGLELQQRMAEMEDAPPIIFVTGHADVKMAVSALQDGAAGFLEKPVQKQELWDCIRKALNEDRKRRTRREKMAVLNERLSRLSEGERSVLDLLLVGKTNRQVAEAMDMSTRTVEDRRARIMKKMEAGSFAELVRMTLLQ